MLFNSYIYIFLFLPVTVYIYFKLVKKSNFAGVIFLIAASIGYYVYWELKDLIVLLISILINFNIGKILSREISNEKKKLKKGVLWFGITLNLLALCYYKYTDFLIANFNAIFGLNTALLKLALPLAISFFTFQQIVYLVESYQGKTKDYKMLDYSLVVLFFPHLLAGPIVNYSEIMAQFSNVKNRFLSFENLNRALFFISIGLFKKVVIADSFSPWVANGFDLSKEVNLVEGWAASLSYTLQLYFDFSGYSDIAIGSALLFNIQFPANFNSPYKAKNIQEFWRRWHISLSLFLRNHIYIPLGGNRNHFKVYFNLFITFFLGGIWHGAGWNFVAWGALHGGAVVLHRFLQGAKVKIHQNVSWFLTFLFVNFAWIFFRAREWDDSIKIIKGMLGLSGIQLPLFLESHLSFLKGYGVNFGAWIYRLEGFGGMKIIPAIIVALGIAFFAKNSQELAQKYKPNLVYMVGTAILFIIATLFISEKAEFLYFNF